MANLVRKKITGLKKPNPELSCQSKRKWNSPEAARNHLAYCRKQSRYGGSHKVYKCRYCDGYHVGRS